MFHRTSFPLFPALFLLSAIFGTLIAVRPTQATLHLAQLVAGMGLAAGLAVLKVRRPQALAFVLALFPLLLSLYFLLTNNWAARIGKVPALDFVLRALAALLPNTQSLALNTNVVGGIIAAYLPLQVAALRHTHRGLAAGLLGVSLLALFITLSRGAWVALGFCAGVWLAWRLSQRVAQPHLRPLLFGLACFGLGSLLVLSLSFAGSERASIWRDSLQLARDYAFTGIGLSSFEMVYSSYLLLVHVPFLYYAHNLFLDIWLGQGLLGLLAFIGWVWVAFRDQDSGAWGTAALVALGVVLVHGLSDDPFYGYGAPLLPLLFVPLALLAAPQPKRNTAGRTYALGAGAVLAAAALAWFVPALRASLFVNLGALSQTQIELSNYTNQKWGIQDNLRRSDAINLQPAISYFQDALNLDATNPTAHLRLGQIDLAYSRFTPACDHFVAAFNASPDNRAARQFMGECAALAAQTDKAMSYWRTIETNQGQLGLRYAWYNDFLSDKVRASLILAATQALTQ